MLKWLSILDDVFGGLECGTIRRHARLGNAGAIIFEYFRLVDIGLHFGDRRPIDQGPIIFCRLQRRRLTSGKWLVLLQNLIYQELIIINHLEPKSATNPLTLINPVIICFAGEEDTGPCAHRLGLTSLTARITLRYSDINGVEHLMVVTGPRAVRIKQELQSVDEMVA